MNKLFSPYVPEIDTDTELVIELQGFIRKFLFFFYKIFPLHS